MISFSAHQNIITALITLWMNLNQTHINSNKNDDTNRKFGIRSWMSYKRNAYDENVKRQREFIETSSIFNDKLLGAQSIIQN